MPSYQELIPNFIQNFIMFNHTMKSPFSSSDLREYPKTMISYNEFIPHNECIPWFPGMISWLLIAFTRFDRYEFMHKSWIHEKNHDFIPWIHTANEFYPFLVGANSCFFVWIHSISHEIHASIRNSGMIHPWN